MTRRIIATLLLLVSASILNAQVSRQTVQIVRMSNGENERVISRTKESSAETYLKWGLVHSAAGEWESAISEFSKVIRIEPMNAVALYNRGNAFQAQDKYELAIADYDEAVRVNPRLSEAYNNRGVAKQSKGDTSGAIADYDQAIKIDPRNARAYANRGLTRLFIGQEMMAEGDFAHCRSIDPRFADSLQTRINRLKQHLSGR